LEASKAEQDTALADAADLQAKIDEQTAAIEELEAIKAASLDEITALRSRTHDSSASASGIEAELSALTTGRDELQIRADEIEARSASLIAEHDAVKAGRDALQARVDEIKLDSTTIERDRLAAEVDNLGDSVGLAAFNKLNQSYAGLQASSEAKITGLAPRKKFLNRKSQPDRPR